MFAVIIHTDAEGQEREMARVLTETHAAHLIENYKSVGFVNAVSENLTAELERRVQRDEEIDRLAEFQAALRRCWFTVEELVPHSKNQAVLIRPEVRKVLCPPNPAAVMAALAGR